MLDVVARVVGPGQFVQREPAAGQQVLRGFPVHRGIDLRLRDDGRADHEMLEVVQPALHAVVRLRLHVQRAADAAERHRQFQ